jgi:hypothetical protein
MTTLCTCGKPTNGDSFICGDCSDAYARSLGDVPSVARELIVTLSKQGRFSDSSTITYRSSGLPYDVRASDALHELRAELVALVRLCNEEHVRSSDPKRVQPDDTLASMSTWLLWRVDGVAAKKWAPDAMQLVTIVDHCEVVVDRPPDRTYAGPCDACSHDLFVEKGELTVVCERCGKSYDLRARREWLLHVVVDRLATAPEIARALTSLELPITHELIRQWRSRGRLTSRTKDRRGVPLYRVGDVVDLLSERARVARDAPA